VSATITEHHPATLAARLTASEGAKMVVTTFHLSHFFDESLTAFRVGRPLAWDDRRLLPANVRSETGNFRMDSPKKSFPVAELMALSSDTADAAVVEVGEKLTTPDNPCIDFNSLMLTTKYPIIKTTTHLANVDDDDDDEDEDNRDGDDGDLLIIMNDLDKGLL
jgi:hypothetical protein